ncbi:hypothetical protein A1O1_00462 [Capronia coronata CBS 617.96]|uniref:Choline transport protein n=1 Tax=Capronia coronata CBS 617.96 TaxID=1182541 RepID=W9YR59_9EURO|nr:uncharacterized protein A1O1_00462 [Capronia coronata CBS 617.96]EXJ95342.1 hypothetical protein A1O1_00462 [Capronia coronata CBS 617.96]
MEKQTPVTGTEKHDLVSSASSGDYNVAAEPVVIEGTQGPKLEKPFSIWSTVGIQYSCMSTPYAVGAFLSLSVGVGGSPVFFFAYLLVVIMNMFVACSLAEIAAVYPHASGQIYWAGVLAPPKHRRGLSYITGWLTSSGWFFWTCGTLLISSQLLWALIQVCYRSFEIHPWHYYMGYLAIGVIGVIVNIPLFNIYPYLLKFLVVYINAGALFIIIALLVRANPKQSASYVFADFVNLTGWSSNGVVFFLGMLPGASSVNGFDGAAHMADEMPNPKKQIPQVMVGSTFAAGLSGIPMILVLMFCVVKPENLLAPIGGQPIVQLMLDGFDSMALTIIGCLLFFTVTLAAAAAQVTTFSRVWWSFARANGVPFSPFMGRVSERWRLPVNSILFTLVAGALIGLIELGSAIALNAILGTAILCIFASYSIPITCLLLERRRSFPARRYFNMGKIAGPIVNIISVFWTAFMFVWLCFPLYLPVTSASMNYAVAVFAGVCLVSTVNWFCYSKKAYLSPVSTDEHIDGLEPSDHA